MILNSWFFAQPILRKTMRRSANQIYSIFPTQIGGLKKKNRNTPKKNTSPIWEIYFKSLTLEWIQAIFGARIPLVKPPPFWRDLFWRWKGRSLIPPTRNPYGRLVTTEWESNIDPIEEMNTQATWCEAFLVGSQNEGKFQFQPNTPNNNSGIRRTPIRFIYTSPNTESLDSYGP